MVRVRYMVRVSFKVSLLPGAIESDSRCAFFPVHCWAPDSELGENFIGFPTVSHSSHYNWLRNTRRV